MPNLNRVTLMGHLTRDPEYRQVGAGAVAKIGLAVNNSRKNKLTGQWESEPVFLDVEIWNWGEVFRAADMVADKGRKGAAVFVEGKLKMESWQDKASGQTRTKLLIAADEVQFLDWQPNPNRGPRQSGPNTATADDAAPADGGETKGSIPF